MIVYLILQGFYSLVSSIISLMPTFETPAWFYTQLPDVLHRVASFNLYLPVYETVGVVMFLIGFTLAYKILKIVLNIVRIDLNQ